MKASSISEALRKDKKTPVSEIGLSNQSWEGIVNTHLIGPENKETLGFKD